MLDISTSSPAITGINLHRAPIAPAKPRIAAAAGADAARTETGRNPGHPPRMGHIHKEPLTGPSPAFQASLLEIESDLKTVIRRVEAARERRRDELALQPPFPEPAASPRAGAEAVATDMPPPR